MLNRFPQSPSLISSVLVSHGKDSLRSVFSGVILVLVVNLGVSQLFQFADKYRGKYDSSIRVAQNYYGSVSGYAVSKSTIH